MRLSIEHTTHYRYEEPALRVIQAFHLWPAPVAGQKVRQWRVTVGSHPLKPTATDGFGNPVATHAFDDPVDSVRIHVTGEVDTEDRHGVVGDAPEPLPPEFFLIETALTAGDAALSELARGIGEDGGDVERMHRLCQAVRARVDYVAEQTDAQTTAAQALAAGAGVCQDHAHVLIACARALGYPARYVSGYLSAGVQGAEAASHAWAEVHLENLGWVGFDAANRICPNEHYVRVACGRDYRDAAPVRGLHQGGAAEHLEVSVRIAETQTQTQSQVQAQNQGQGQNQTSQ